MSMQLAQTFNQALGDILPISDVVGMKADVQAAMQLLETVETAEDLYAIYRTDVTPGNMSIRNLLLVLQGRMQEINCRSSYAMERLKMILASPHVESLHKVMKEKKKGDTTVNLYQPTFTSSDLDKAIEDFKDGMGENYKPKLEYATKKGKGARLRRLHALCKPITLNSKKNYSQSQIDTAKRLVKVMRHT